MIRHRGFAVIAIALFGTGCASAPGPSTADLTAPPSPRLEWKRTPQTASKSSAPRAQDLIIREHRFVSHSPELNLDGEDQIQRILAALKNSHAKIVIESCNGTPILPTALADNVHESSKLDVQRRQYVIQKLLSLGIPDAEERVVLEPAAS